MTRPNTDKVSTSTPRKWLWRMAYAVLAVIFLLLIALLCARLFLKTQSGATWIESRIEALSPMGQNIELTNLKGDALSEFTIERLEISDDRGVWLVIDNAKIDWVPTSLLRKNLNIQTISASKVSVLDRPNLIRNPDGAPSPIEQYMIASISLPVIDLSEQVVPRAISLSATGSAQMDQTGGALKLQAKNLGQPMTDEADIDLSWSAETLISGTADISSAPDGIISTLLQLQSKDLLELKVATNGPANDLTTEISGKVGTDNFLTGEIQSLDDQVKASLSFDPKYIATTSPYEAWLGGAVDINVQSLPEERQYRIGAKAPKLDFKSILALDEDVMRFSDLTLIADNPLTALQDAPAAMSQLKVTGQASYGEQSAFNGTIIGSGIEYGEYDIQSLSGDVVLSLEDDTVIFSSDLSGSGISAGPDTSFDGMMPKANATGRYNLSTQFLSLSRADIRLPGLIFSGAGDISIASKSADFRGEYDVRKSFLSLDLPADIMGKVIATRSGDATNVKVEGNAMNIASLPDQLSDIVGDQARFSLNADLTGQESIILRNYRLSADKVDVSGSGSYNLDGKINMRAKYQLDTFAINNLEVASLSGDADISGALGNLSFDIYGRSPKTSINERDVENLTFEADGKQSGQSYEADINLTGDMAEGPISLKSQASYSDSNWALRDLTGSLGTLTANGEVSGRGGDITALNAGLEIQGDPSPFLPAQAVDLTVKLDNAAANISGTISEINAGPLSSGKLELTANGPRNAIAYDTTITGQTLIADITRPLDASFKGTADLSGQYFSTLTDITGTLGQYEFKTAREIALRQTDNGLAGGGEMALLGGSVELDVSGNERSAEFEIDTLSLPEILQLLGRPVVAGVINGSGSVNASSGGLNGQALLNVIDVKQPGSDMQPVSVTVETQITNNRLSAVATTDAQGLTGKATLSGNLQTTASAPYVAWPPASPLTGTATVNGDIGSLAEFFLPPETDMTGNLDLDMSYSVPFKPELTTGTLSMQNGIFESGTIGLKLKDMAFDAALDNSVLTVSNFTASGADGGSLTGGGRTSLRLEDGAKIGLSAKKLRIFDRQEGSAVVSGNINFSQQNKKLTLSGELTADDASINIDKFPSPGLPTLDVDFSVQEVDEVPVEKTITALDLSLVSAGKIKLRGRGVNANMDVRAKVVGAFDAPELTGRARIARGRFDFLGKRFEFADDSQVTFAPNIQESRLDITARRETNDLTAIVRITGTVERPEMELEAEPQLPEDEVLSRILFGRSPSQLTTIETARLAAALAQLSGGGGFDLLGNIEDALGLDTLDFNQTEAGQSQLTTGKYLSDDVYVEVRSSAEGTPGLAVEWTPRRSISVEAETSPGETQRLSVQWKKDFD